MFLHRVILQGSLFCLFSAFLRIALISGYLGAEAAGKSFCF